MAQTLLYFFVAKLIHFSRGRNNMKEKKRTYILAAILVVVACTVISMRLHFDHYNELLPGESLWRLIYNIKVENAPKGSKVNIAFPQSTSRAQIIKETFVRSGWAIDIVSHSRNKNREATAVVIAENSNISFTAQFDIQMDAKKQFTPEQKKLAVEMRATYLSEKNGILLNHPTIKILAKKIKHDAKIKKEIAEKVFNYCSEKIDKGDADESDDVLPTLKTKKGSCIGIARTMVSLCRVLKIPSRLVTGFIIEPKYGLKPHSWVELYIEKTWIPYDPYFGYQEATPHNYLPVTYGKPDIVRVSKTENWKIQFFIERIQDSYAPTKSLMTITDLTRMGIGTRTILSIILLLPLAALITIVFRNIIGIQTFGTFSPCLLALSFVYADWRTGLLTIVLVFAIGLLLRTLLKNLKLLVIARLGVMLSIVVLCMVLSVSILDYFQLTPGENAVLLPIVVITMLIESFHVTWEEDGVRYALKLSLNTLIVAMCCYLIISWQYLGYLAIVFPEGQLFIIAGMLIIGRYAGYRLTEWLRFRDLIKE